MIEIIEQYSNQITMIITAILPALTALAALISIVRNDKKSRKEISENSAKMLKETTNIKKINVTLSGITGLLTETNKRINSLENQVSSLTQEIVYLKNGGTGGGKTDTQ